MIDFISEELIFLQGLWIYNQETGQLSYRGYYFFTGVIKGFPAQ